MGGGKGNLMARKRISKRSRDLAQSAMFFVATFCVIASLILYLWVYTQIDETLLVIEIQNITVNEPINKNIYSKSKKSISKFKKITYLNDATLAEIEIYTGRSHQIRIHASLINHPILFDNKYGDFKLNNSFDKGIKKYIALHAKSICFKNSNSKLIDISCSPPKEFNNLIELLNY